MHFLRTLVLLASCPVIACSAQDLHAPTSEVASRSVDKADIQRVMTLFHEAVVSHNSSGVSALVVPEGSAWFNVLSDGEYARAVSRNPSAVKVRRSSLEEFSKFVSGTKAALDPQHTNIVILSDGTIASVYFDFAFLINGKAENRGSETWQLVKTIDGWKIAALTYSSDPQRGQ